ncbi:hypothetical protein BLNAU_13725 [Blattamonas nauphoetae]|uniref:Uncharacterized protein n=1 Tax=Blattamonas nauphoetae TaxID=2049346 RepID=A0ABQ9XH55_9EUKA|nr:hypothetical protein BLNAU_13725 [Blattamonas nauphoetae]
MTTLDFSKTAVRISYANIASDLADSVSLIFGVDSDFCQHTLKNSAEFFDFRFTRDEPRIKSMAERIQGIDEIEDFVSPIVMSALPVIKTNLSAIVNEVETFLNGRTRSHEEALSALKQEEKKIEDDFQLRKQQENQQHKQMIQKLVAKSQPLSKKVIIPRTDSLSETRSIGSFNSRDSVRSEKIHQQANNEIDGDDHIPEDGHLSPKYEFQDGQDDENGDAES